MTIEAKPTDRLYVNFAGSSKKSRVPPRSPGGLMYAAQKAITVEVEGETRCHPMEYHRRRHSSFPQFLLAVL